ncbi:MAG: SUMF1/EgtB/PvdO family nonheme iron enzyme [Candidatus Cloacimonetes bacterium]|nr:SUMF1/EgtB/PvdO family nonheme iron enzyme [Candidatus Cloacimonadota bacterium]
MKREKRGLVLFIIVLFICTLNSEELRMKESGHYIKFTVDDSNIDFLSKLFSNINSIGDYDEFVDDQNIFQLLKEKNIGYNFVGVQYSYQSQRIPDRESRDQLLGSNTNNYNIPDLGSTASNFTMSNAPNGATITGISYDVKVIHTWISDLLLEINNGNRYLTVWNHAGGSDDDIYLNWIWSSYFDGEPLNDTWSLYAEDTVAGDTGYIDWFKINFFYDPPLPDLVIQNELVNNSSSSVEVYPGDQLSTSCRVRNIGDATADPEWVGYYFENDVPTSFNDLDNYIGNDGYGGWITGLPPNGYEDETYNYTVPTNTNPGPYFFAFYADYQEDTSESNEDNNLEYVTVYVLTPQQITQQYWSTTSSSGNEISNNTYFEAGTTIYLNVHATGYSSVDCYIYEDDIVRDGEQRLERDQLQSTVTVTGLSDGFGYATYTLPWVDDVSGGPEFYFRVLNSSSHQSNLVRVQDTTDPSVPVLSSPSNGTSFNFNQNTISFDWQNSNDGSGSGIDDYHIQVSTTSTFSTIEWEVNRSSSDASHTFDSGDTYYWHVNATDNQNNTSNYCSIRSFSISQPPPDLIIDNIYNLASSYYPGDTIEISFGVRNQGDGDSPPAEVGLYFSTSQYYVNGQPYDTFTTNSLVSNEIEYYTLSTTIPDNLTEGTIWANLYVDYNQVITEEEEGNNVNGESFTYYASDPPEISTYSPIPPLNIYTNDQITFNVQGSDQNGDLFQVKWWVNGGLIETHSISGSTFNDSYTKTGFAAIQNEITAIVWDEQGNCDEQAWVFTPVLPLPDLIVDNIYNLASTYYSGDDIEISFGVRNQGDGDSPPAEVGLYFSTSQYYVNGQLYDTFSTNSIVSGDIEYYTLNATVPDNLTEGIIWANLYVDYNQLIIEEDEDNNVDGESFEYNVPGLPEITNADLSPDMDFYPGQIFTASYTVDNSSNINIDGFLWFRVNTETGHYFTFPDESGEYYVPVTFTPGEHTYSRTCVISENTDPGTHDADLVITPTDGVWGDYWDWYEYPDALVIADLELNIISPVNDLELVQGDSFEIIWESNADFVSIFYDNDTNMENGGVNWIAALQEPNGNIPYNTSNFNLGVPYYIGVLASIREDDEVIFDVIEYATGTVTVLEENNPPYVDLESIQVPDALVSNNNLLTVAYCNEEGIEDIRYCGLRLDHPDPNVNDITMFYDNENDEWYLWEEYGIGYANLDDNPNVNTIGNNLSIIWNFDLLSTWPNTSEGIDVLFYVEDYDGNNNDWVSGNIDNLGYLDQSGLYYISGLGYEMQNNNLVVIDIGIFALTQSDGLTLSINSQNGNIISNIQNDPIEITLAGITNFEYPLQLNSNDPFIEDIAVDLRFEGEILTIPYSIRLDLNSISIINDDIAFSDQSQTLGGETIQSIIERFSPILKTDEIDDYRDHAPKDINAMINASETGEFEEMSIVEGGIYSHSVTSPGDFNTFNFVDSKLDLPNVDTFSQSHHEWSDDALQYLSELPNKIYARACEQFINLDGDELTYSGNSLIIQYWFPHIVNNLSNVPGVLAGNYHEGDVENATVILSLEEDIGYLKPLAMILSKHYSGSWSKWSEIEKSIEEDNLTEHPIIYIANGSHANFFSSNSEELTHSSTNADHDIHQGRGFWLSNNDINGEDFVYEVSLLPSLNDINSDNNSYSWLKYSGHWGSSIYDARLGISNPSPPMYPFTKYAHDGDIYRWLNPSGWIEHCIDVEEEYDHFDLGDDYLPELVNIETTYSGNNVIISGEIVIDELHDFDGYRIGFPLGYSQTSQLISNDVGIQNFELSVPNESFDFDDKIYLVSMNESLSQYHGNMMYEYVNMAIYETITIPNIAPEMPEDLYPDDGITLLDLFPTFSWSDFQDGGDGEICSGYQFRVLCDENNDEIVYDTGLIESAPFNFHTYSPGTYTGIDLVTGDERVSEHLEWFTHYHWHVRYQDSGGDWSSWSADDLDSHQDFYTPQEPTLNAEPEFIPITYSEGNESFVISNAGGSTMNWNAIVTDGSDWLTIFSGSSGTNTGYVVIQFDENTSLESRTGIIEITSSEAGNSPIEVIVYQYGTDMLNAPQIVSSDPETATWSNDNEINIAWEEPSSDRINLVLENENVEKIQNNLSRAVQGYCWSWDNLSQNNPGEDFCTNVLSTTSNPLADSNNWYFHIKAQDNNDNWGEITNYGPFYIDCTSPNGSISINDNATTTDSMIVDINLEMVDETSGISQMRYSNDGNSWSNWESFSPSKTNWDLATYGGNQIEGTKTVFCEVSDLAENIVQLEDQIILQYPDLVVDFIGEPTEVGIDEVVQFTDISTGNPTSWQWDFDNDGTVDSYIQDPVHAYPVAGTYTITLTISNELSRETTTMIKEDYITVNDAINPNELIAYYPFNGNADDESGNGNNGSINGADPVYDRFNSPNSAFEFDGSSDYIEVQDSGSFGLNEHSLVTWVNFDATGTRQLILGKHSNDGSWNDPYNIQLRNDHIHYSTRSNSTSVEQFLESDFIPEIDRWYFVAATYDGNTMSLYINDDTVLTIETEYDHLSSSDSNLRMGCSSSGSDYNFFDGKIDDVRIYDYALSESEIDNLYHENGWDEIVADFEAYPSNASVEETIQFTDLSVPQELIVSWAWDFENDGIIDSSNPNPVYAYPDSGEYSVSLTIEDTFGNTDTIVKENYITVNEGLNSEGLIAYYPFNGNAIDESGNGWDGTQYGNLDFSVADRFGNPNSAAFFDGIDDYISIGNEIDVTNNLPFSVSLWVSSNDIRNSGIISKYLNHSYNGFLFEQFESSEMRALYSNNQVNMVSCTAPVIADEYYHIAITASEDELNLYVNNQLASNDSWNGLSATSDAELIIGANTDDPDYTIHAFFSGIIDDIRIYNRELLPEDISNLYHENGWDIFEEGLIAHYPLNGNAEEISGFDHQGIVYGAQPTEDRFSNSSGAMLFDGIDQFISTDLVLQYNNDDSFTWSVWIRSDAIVNSTGLSVAMGFEGTNAGEIKVGVYDSNNPNANKAVARSRCDAYASHGGEHIAYSYNPIANDNQWHYLVWIRDRENLQYKFYMDGNLEMSLDDNNDNFINGSSRLLGIGCQSHNAGWENYFNGAIDDVRIYNRTLSEQEMSDLYHEGDWDIEENELVAHYPLDGDTNDVSIYGNNGSISGAIPAPDRFNNENSAYDFDGQNDVLNAGDYHLWDDEISLSIWINPQSYSNGGNPLFDKHDEFNLTVPLGDSLSFHLVNVGTLKAPNVPQIGNWSHIVASYDNNLMKLYLDNLLIAEKEYSGQIPDSGYPLYIASDETAVHNYLDATIDDVRIYNYSLSESEIDDLYHESGWDVIVADFEAYPAIASIGDSIQFTDLSIPLELITSWAWDFTNDGIIDSNDPNPVYAYLDSGEYSVNLTIEDTYGNTDTVVKENYITVNEVSIPDGLIAYYPFNGNAYDESGNGNNGDAHEVTISNDRFGNDNSAYEFDGESSKINLGSDDSIDFLFSPTKMDSSFTISIWFNLYSLQPQFGFYPLLHIGQSSPSWQFNIGIRDIDFGENIYCGSHGFIENMYANNPTEIDMWYHTLTVYDGSSHTAMLYVNNELNASIIVSPGDSENEDENVYIGYGQAWDSHFNGLIDDVRIYNYALSESDIDELYHENGWDEATITISNPNSSTIWNQGEGFSIDWTDATGSEVQFLIFKDGLELGICHEWTANDGNCNGSLVNPSWGTGSGYQIKAIDSDGNFGWSEEFVIEDGSSIEVTNPNSSTIWYQESDFYIEWSGSEADHVEVIIYQDENEIGICHQLTLNDGICHGLVESYWGTGSNFRVKVVDDNGEFGWSEEFRIEAANEFECSYVEAGDFTFGQNDDIQTIDYDYKIMKYEVTNAQYLEYLEAALEDSLIWIQDGNVYGYYEGDDVNPTGNYLFYYLNYPINYNYARISYDRNSFVIEIPPSYNAGDFDNHPVVCVSWFGANAFANYYGLRLPSEFEWEKAARGLSGSDYPWGDQLDGSRANYYQSGDPWDNGTTPVGYFNGQDSTQMTYSKYGCFDMCGNVWDWTTDFSDSYRKLKGGSWWSEDSNNDLKSWFDYDSSYETYYTYGFRCVKDTALTNSAPDLPVNPIPETGAINVDIDMILTWECSDPDNDQLTYDVYLGTVPQLDENHLKISGINFTSYEPDSLDFNTPFYWKIVASDGELETEGEIWSFVTTTGSIEDSWAYVEAGEFTWGQNDEILTIDYDYEIMKYEVTNAQYVEYLEAAFADSMIWIQDGDVYGHYETGDYKFYDLGTPSSDNYARISYDGCSFIINVPSSFNSGEFDNHPVVYVTWYGANDYVEYYGWKLPTEQEWEKAARGMTGYEYPWGDSLSGDRANYRDSGDVWDNGTTPVGFYNGQNFNGFQTTNSQSPYGCYDMSGNVWDWIDSDNNLRGGSWSGSSSSSSDFLSWTQHNISPTYSHYGHGFRCVRNDELTLQLNLPESIEFNEDESTSRDIGEYITYTYPEELNISCDGNSNIIISDDGLVLHFCATENWFGQELIYVSVFTNTSRQSVTDSMFITVLPVNDPPELIILLPNIEFYEDTQSVPLDLSLYFVDVDGDELSYSVASLDTAGIFEINNYILTISVDENWNGIFDVYLTASDSYSRLSVTDTMMVTVFPVNDPPVIEFTESISFTDFATVDFSSNIYDVDGDEVTLTASGNENIIVEIDMPYVTFSVDNWFGSEWITFTVDDNVSRLTASDSVLVTSLSPCTPPDWQVNPADYEYNGSIWSIVFLEDVQIDHTNGILGCFVDEECRGIASFANGTVVDYTDVPIFNHVAFMPMIYSNETSGEILDFVYWDPYTCEQFNVSEHLGFVADMAIGDGITPFEFHASPEIPISKSLTAGWNWISLNVLSESMNINNVLSSIGESGDYIKNQATFATYYPGAGWFGSLNEISIYSMYMLDMNQPDTLEFLGSPIDVIDTEFNIVHGWNWISFAPQESEPINYALYGLDDNASYIKNQTSFANYYTGAGWFGALSSMSPLDGYKLDADSVCVFTYPSPETVSRGCKDNFTTFKHDNILRSFNLNQYEFNGSLTLASENNIPVTSRIIAYCDDEIRGISTLLDYTEQLGRKYYALMVYSNLEYEEGFQLYYQEDAGSEMIPLDYSFNFESDMILGDFMEPVVITLPNVDNDEVINPQNTFSVYPNPFNPETTIQFNVAEDCQVSLDVYNIKGQKIVSLINDKLESGNHSVTWNAESFSSGIYYLRLETDGKVQYRKSILLK